MFGELLQQPPIEIALERYDQLRKLLRLDPLPVAKLRMLCGDVHVRIGAEEAGEEPVLVLPLPFAAPKLAPKLGRKVVYSRPEAATSRSSAHFASK